MTDEEKKKYREKLLTICNNYCHIDYDDDSDIVELMFDVTLEEMTELIKNFDPFNMTNRQKLLAFVAVKELYDNREKYQKDKKNLSNAVSSMLLKEMYKAEDESEEEKPNITIEFENRIKDYVDKQLGVIENGAY